MTRVRPATWAGRNLGAAVPAVRSSVTHRGAPSCKKVRARVVPGSDFPGYAGAMMLPLRRWISRSVSLCRGTHWLSAERPCGIVGYPIIAACAPLRG